MDNKEKVKYWLDIADYDLQTARAMFSSKIVIRTIRIDFHLRLPGRKQ
jgi:hypothetical protein